jgi:hypothetical protein
MVQAPEPGDPAAPPRAALAASGARDTEQLRAGLAKRAIVLARLVGALPLLPTPYEADQLLCAADDVLRLAARLPVAAAVGGGGGGHVDLAPWMRSV